jgi:hypothetical protein
MKYSHLQNKKIAATAVFSGMSFKEVEKIFIND